MDPERIRQVMRYAVAVASNDDDFRRRKLGPIHLIKYVYLADLAYAAKNQGRTFTGVSWRFHHFGPWAVPVWQEIKPAMAFPAIRKHSFSGRFQDDIERWCTTDPDLENRLEGGLPLPVARAVKSVTREFANDTPGLLHHVYRTQPMLRAAPEERLDFSSVEKPEDGASSETVAERPKPGKMPKAARKRRKAAHDDLRARFQSALERGRHARPRGKVDPPPRYDEVFAKGQEWLDQLAGSPIEPIEGEFVVSKEVWKSPARSDPGIP